MSTRALQIECLMTPLIDYRDGSICSAYTAYFYSAGTSTAKNVWTEKEKTNAFTSKALGSSGAIQLYGDGVYKIIVKDADATTVYEWDNVKVQHPNIAVLSKSGTYTATVDDDYIIVGATMTLNLFAAASATHPICVKLNGSYTLTIDPSGAELIDGSSTYSLTTSGAAVWLFAYGSAWYVANATSVTAVSAINLVASIGGSAELTAKATTIDIMTNNQYLRQLDNAGTGYVNLIKGNASDQIELGANVKDITLLNTGLHILDSNASHDLIIKPGSNLTADKTLTVTTGDADRTITLSGNPTLSDWFNQEIKTTSSPTFTDVVIGSTSFLGDAFAGYANRSKFRWKDGDEIYIGPGCYHHEGTTTQLVFWESELTFHLEEAGSNSDSHDYGDDGWHYIYIDDSAVITQADTLLDADCFANYTGANAIPVWSVTKRGWYGSGVGDAKTGDRCIFAVYETGGAILEFIHDGGDFVLYADRISDRTAATATATFTDQDVTLTIPGFATKAQVQFTMANVNGDDPGYWRTNGQTGSSGHRYCFVNAGSTYSYNTIMVITDATGKIEISHGAATNATTTINTDGFYFPNGM